MAKDLVQLLKSLNPQQREAVETLQGPVLVVAGPGTGKTQVLALRIANILASTDTKAANILCLTFTESGVNAMRKRLISIIGNEAYYIRIHTFHSFAGEVMQSFADKFATQRQLIQITDIERVKLIQGILDSISLDKPMELRPFYDAYAYQRDISQAISDLKREGIGVDEFKQIAQTNWQEFKNSPKLNPKTGKPTSDWLSGQKNAARNLELAEIYAAYQSELAAKGWYDYEDMVLFVVNKFAEDDELLAHYQERYLHILVDEYQDTNGAQNQLIKLLCSFDSSPNIFAVGDDDQAIYRFQGANVANLLAFNQMFKDVKQIAITTNYRSSQTILDAANSVISHNTQRLADPAKGLDKSLISGRDLPLVLPKIYECESSLQEIKLVTDKIKQLLAEGVDPNAIAVIYRKHSDADDLINAMIHMQMPLQISAGSNLLQDRNVQKLINLLRSIAQEGNDRDKLLVQVMFYDFLGLPRLGVFKLIRHVRESKTGVWETAINLPQEKSIHSDGAATLHQFAQRLIDWQAVFANQGLAAGLEIVARESGFTSFIFGSHGRDADTESINSANSFFDYVRQFNRLHPDASLADLLADIKLSEDYSLVIPKQSVNTEVTGVNLLTAHAAKGLEFDYVFIYRCYDGNWGGRSARKIIKLPQQVFAKQLAQATQQVGIDLQTEDERRLFFVALTRAKLAAYITYAQTYPTQQSTKEVSPSEFIGDIHAELIEKQAAGDSAVLDLEWMSKQMGPPPIPDYTQAEKGYLTSVLAEFKISASSLNEYLECPLKFKFNRLLKIPQPQQRALALGTAVHFALEHFHRQLMQGVQKDLGYLKFLLNKALEKELLGQADRQAAIVEGEKLLTGYYEHYQGEFVPPVEVEYGFYGRQMMLTGKGFEPIPLTGKLDKLTWVDKQKGLVKVTDYKTSSPMTRNEILGVTKNSEGNIFRQLVFYHLLADLDDKFRPNPNAPKYKITEVEVDFVKPDSQGRYKREIFEISAADVAELRDLVVNVMSHIRRLEFLGTPDHPLCGKCEYCQMFGG